MEDTKGLPDVKGLEGFVSQDIQDKVTPTPEIQAQPPKTEQSRNALGQFKTQEDLVTSYKELQGFSTRVAQENKELKDNLAKTQAQFTEQMELMKYQRPVQNVQPPQRDFDSMFIENPQQAVASVAAQMVHTQMMQSRVAEALEVEHIKNPSEYQERFAYAQQLSIQYPQLTQSAPGIRKLFEMADKFRKEDYQKKGMAFVKAVIGEDADFDKFKVLLRKEEAGKLTQTNNAYMPDTSSSSRSGTDSDTRKTGYDTEIQASVAKGDVDNVIANLFRQKLAT
jgi:hypothetical protein